jgi:hypothetical protein
LFQENSLKESFISHLDRLKAKYAELDHIQATKPISAAISELCGRWAKVLGDDINSRAEDSPVDLLVRISEAEESMSKSSIFYVIPILPISLPTS